MRRFQFRLERVLKLKEQAERAAELRLKQARVTLEQARAEVVALWGRLTQNAVALAGRVGTPVPTGSWVAYYEHSAQLAQALNVAEANAQRALQALQEAAAQRAKIATEVETLKYLRHQQWQEHWAEVARLEQIRLDDLGMRRWRAAQAAEPPPEPAAREANGP
jgi:flagellar export protein FliJ